MATIRPVTINLNGAEMITPVGMFLLAANTIYTDEYVASQDRVQNARSLMNGILAAARQAGCRQTDKLRKLLKSDRLSAPVLKKAQQACDAVPSAVMNRLLLQSHGQATAGAWLCSSHGACDAFLGAGDQLVLIVQPDIAPPQNGSGAQA